MIKSGETLTLPSQWPEKTTIIANPIPNEKKRYLLYGLKSKNVEIL